ncbi:N-acetyltransferase [Clostridiaceae bacterium]|jgi:ribosomal protein S18 acetylase RimI-like enzyme|nr:GNAT family N-acetyltransferase [Clostridium sp.]NBI69560.1 N-acetyltransferase [Clostridiaceae bacterium]
MNYAKASETDIPALIDMRIAYLTEDYQTLSAEQADAIRAQLPGYLRGHLNRDLIAYVAKHEREIVASAFLHITEMPANPAVLTGKFGVMLNVYTKPGYRRMGTANQLLNMAIEDGRELSLSYISLEATQDGLPLYRKLNFTEINSRYTGMILKL